MQEITREQLLEGFADLVAERYGYWAGSRLTRQEMNKAVKDSAKALSEQRKSLRQTVEDREEFVKRFLADPSDDELRQTILNHDKDIITAEKDIGVKSKALAKEKKPYLDKVKPLTSGVKYIDTVAIPDSLKELGKPVQPRFSLSKLISEAIEASKKK